MGAIPRLPINYPGRLFFLFLLLFKEIFFKNYLFYVNFQKYARGFDLLWPSMNSEDKLYFIKNLRLYNVSIQRNFHQNQLINECTRKKKAKISGPNAKHDHGPIRVLKGPQGTTHSMVPLRDQDLDPKSRVQNMVPE